MDIPKAARECIEETAALIGRFGPRLAGSEATRGTAEELAEERKRPGFEGRPRGSTLRARTGIRASTIIAMPTAIVRDGLVYHTPRDTADRIEPGAIEACMRIALRFLASLEGR